MTGVVDLAERCPQCGLPWSEHPELDAEGRDYAGRRICDMVASPDRLVLLRRRP